MPPTPDRSGYPAPPIQLEGGVKADSGDTLCKQSPQQSVRIQLPEPALLEIQLFNLAGKSQQILKKEVLYTGKIVEEINIPQQNSVFFLIFMVNGETVYTQKLLGLE